MNSMALELRGLDEGSLYRGLGDDSRFPVDAVRAEIRRREMERLPAGIAEVLTSRPTIIPPPLLAEVRSVTFGTTDYDDGWAWGTKGAVLLADGRRVTVGFEDAAVADSLVELSEHAENPLTASDTLTVEVAGCAPLRPVLLTWQAGDEQHEERGLAWEEVKTLTKLFEGLDYGFADLAGAPSVFGLNERGQRFPLTVRVDREPFDSSDFSYRTVVVTWPDGATVEAGYRIDGRA
ncbi:hypothetical protein E1091_00305 [Micromonospora fluostatini]|uniref:Uncharacterized protein n=1 Tax=Micromonospora fluostatini TaxID=1629071 RepID=A0ABY2DQD4_9ACTN|nr:hypothetical protein E1091_00305 [Micromonospora fluostatini]